MKYIVILSALFAFSAFANQGDDKKAATQEATATSTMQDQSVIKSKKATEEAEDASTQQQKDVKDTNNTQQGK